MMRNISLIAIAFAGLIHLGIAPASFARIPAHGIFFALIGAAQVIWALAFWRRPSPVVYRVGLALSGGAITLWAITRVLAAPFDYEPGSVDVLGLIGTGSELIGILALATLAVQGKLANADRAPVLQVVGQVLSLALVGLMAFGAGQVVEPLLPALGLQATHTSVKVSPLRIEGVWARPVIARGNGAVYFAVVNTGQTPDRLMNVQADVASSAELHQTTMEGGVMKMRPVTGGAEVPAGGKVELEPGGLHVMLVGLRKELKAGDTFPITLRFQNAGEVSVQVKVREQ